MKIHSVIPGTRPPSLMHLEQRDDTGQRFSGRSQIHDRSSPRRASLQIHDRSSPRYLSTLFRYAVVQGLAMAMSEYPFKARQRPPSIVCNQEQGCMSPATHDEDTTNPGMMSIGVPMENVYGTGGLRLERYRYSEVVIPARKDEKSR
jgi:hypothetical protein